MNEQEARVFAERWLAEWTGNHPEALLQFYAPEALYRDPARPLGLRGHSALRPYFQRLLAANPAWVWTVTEVFPTAGGFTLKWHAKIPAGDALIEEDGLDIVEVADGLITRNEVYFNATALHAATQKGA